MKKTYKTTFEIEAEQFDGSEEMAKEYEMMRSPAGVYHVNAFDGFKAIREGDWLISDGEDIAIADDEYFEEHYELVEDDDPTAGLAKLIDEYNIAEREAQGENIRRSWNPDLVAAEVHSIARKVDEIQKQLEDQEKIRQDVMAAKARGYSNLVDELADLIMTS